MDIASHLKKADEATRRKNFKHAVALYRQVLNFKPDNGEARRGLFRTLTKQAEVKKPSPLLAKLGGSPHLLSMMLARVSKNPAQLAKAADKYLCLDPLNDSVALTLAESLAEAGHLNSAVAVYESLGERQNTDALREAGAVHLRLGNADAAMDCLDRCLKANPRDAEAEKLRKNAAAEMALSGGYEGAKSSRELVRDKTQARELEASQRLHRTDDEMESDVESLQARLESNPEDSRASRKLIDLYRRKEAYEEAMDVVDKALEHNAGSSDLKDAKGDLQVALFTREIRKLKQRVKEGGGEGVQEDLKDLQMEALEFEVEEYRRRVSERPTELGLWYQLGLRLLKSKDVDGAIEAFQRSVKDPKRRVDSLTRLSQCFFQNGLFDLAEKQLVTALETMSPDSDRGKEALYNLGLISEKDGRPKDAISYYSRIYEVDISYRDVAQKIKSLS